MPPSPLRDGAAAPPRRAVLQSLACDGDYQVCVEDLRSQPSPRGARPCAAVLPSAGAAGIRIGRRDDGAVPRSRAVAADAAVEAPTIAEISNAVGTSGGKLKTSEEIRVLIRRVAQATKYWSASKIHRENGVPLPCACCSETVQR
jgi:hypothetical protein